MKENYKRVFDECDEEMPFVNTEKLYDTVVPKLSGKIGTIVIFGTAGEI